MKQYNFKFGSVRFDVLEHVAKVEKYDYDRQRYMFECMLYSAEGFDMEHTVLMAYARQLELDADTAENYLFC